MPTGQMSSGSLRIPDKVAATVSLTAMITIRFTTRPPEAISFGILCRRTIAPSPKSQGRVKVRLLAHQGKASSGMPQDGCRLLGVRKRVYRRVGNELCAEHRGGESPKVDTRVSKLLGQLRDSAWAVRANDSN